MKFMLVNFRMGYKMVRGNIYGKMVQFIREDGRMGKGMVWVFIKMKIMNMKVNG